MRLLVAIIFTLLPTLAVAQFAPPNLANIEAEVEGAWDFVKSEMHNDTTLPSRKRFAELLPGWSVTAAPTCASLKPTVYEVPEGVNYSLQSLHLNNKGPFLCNFSAESYTIENQGYNYPANIGLLMHCSCRDGTTLWRKTKHSDAGFTIRPLDWYIWDEIP